MNTTIALPCRFTLVILTAVLAGCDPSHHVVTESDIRVMVYRETQQGDPFGGPVTIKSEIVGELRHNGVGASVLQSLKSQACDTKTKIPAMGVVARLGFVNATGAETAAARLYLPHGLLVLISPESKAGRFSTLNAQVLELLRAKQPDYVAELEDSLVTHGYTLTSMVSSEE